MLKYFPLLLLFITSEIFGQKNEVLNQTDVVDFKNASATISIHPERSSVEGTVEYSFDVLKETDSIFIDAENMNFSKVLLNGAPVEFRNDKKQLWVINNFKPSTENKMVINYSANPKEAMYFINWNVTDEVKAAKQVWTQGQGKNNSHWIPSFNDMREKVIFDLNVNFREGFEVAANGILTEKKILNDSIVQWRYDMKDPMSSYLLAIIAGKYEVQEIKSASGVPIKLYFQPEDQNKVEPTYRYTQEIFDFFESETGYAYPWQNYKQIPVQDFLYSGMENTGTTIFTGSLVVDSTAYNDQNYVNVNAHELAHQWFGNLVTAENGEHHWLHEGFATFYALLAEKKIFGDDYYYWKLYQSAEELKELSDGGKGEALLNTSAGSLTYYQKGAWALHILKEKVGEKAFNQAVKNYLDKNAFKNVNTYDFLSEVEKISGEDLAAYRKNWLEQSAFQATDALNSLKKSEFIKNYLELAALREIPFQNKIKQLNAALDFPINDYLGQEVVYQLAGETSAEALPLYRKAFESGNLYVRQAIALSMENIPSSLKSQFISLLKDDSYLTKENAFLKLWLQYPQEAQKWLDATKGIEGFSNKNVRMLWLVVNLVNPQIDPNKTQEYFSELSGYTASHYPFEIRENAFGYLYQLNAFTDKNLVDLLEAAQHHTFRFRDFSRKLLAKLLENPEYQRKYKELEQNLSAKNKSFLSSRLRK